MTQADTSKVKALGHSSGLTGSQKHLATRDQSNEPLTETRAADIKQLPKTGYDDQSMQHSVEYLPISNHDDRRSNTNKREFFQEYTSHLRIQTRVNDLCKLKQELQLPQLAMKRNLMKDPLDQLIDGKKKRSSSVRPSESAHPASALRNDPSVSALVDRARGSNSRTHIKQLSQRGTQNYKDLLNDIASSRNLMLANTPRQMQLIAASKGAKMSPRLTNRSMLNGSNARLLEKRYSKLIGSPSGLTLRHPGSRVRDHPADLVKMHGSSDTGISRPAIDPSYSLTTMIQAKNFIPASVDQEGSRQATFNKRSMSLQPAPQQLVGEQLQFTQPTSFLKQDASLISVRIQGAQAPVHMQRKPSFSYAAQHAIDYGIRGQEDNQDEQQLVQTATESRESSRQPVHSPSQIEYFTLNVPVKITQLRSPLPSQMKESKELSVRRNIFNRSGSHALSMPDAAFMSPGASKQQLLSPQASTRSMFGTHKKSEAIVSRNILNQVVAKTTNNDKSPSILETSQSAYGTPSPVKKGKLRQNIDPLDKLSGLEIPRAHKDVQLISPKKKVQRVEEIVGKPFAKHIDEVHERHLPKPKIRLRVSLKRKTHLEEEDYYDWSEEKLYNIEQTFDVLDAMPVADKPKEHMALLKNLNAKMEEANIHMSQGIAQQSKKVQNIMKVLDIQHKYQRDPNSSLGFEKYQVIKDIYKKQVEEQKAIAKKNKRAEQIAGDGVTTVAQSRTGQSRTNLNNTGTDDGATTFRPDSEFERPVPLLQIGSQKGEPITPGLPRDLTSMLSGQLLLDNPLRGASENTEKTAMKKTFNLQKGKQGSDMMLNLDDDLVRDVPKDVESSLKGSAVDVAQEIVLLNNNDSIFNLVDKKDDSGKQEGDEVIEEDRADSKKDDDKQSKKDDEKESEGSLRVDNEKSPGLKTVDAESLVSVSNVTESAQDDKTGDDQKLVTKAQTQLELGAKQNLSEALVNEKERHNSMMYNQLKGPLAIAEKKSYIKLDLDSKKQSSILEEGLSDNSFRSDSQKELIDGDEPTPLRRQEGKRSKDLVTQVTPSINQNQSFRLSNTFDSDSDHRKQETVISEKTGEETSLMETDSQITTSSVAHSRDTVGVHDLIIAEEQLGEKRMPRTGKYAAIKEDPSTKSQGVSRYYKDAYHLQDEYVSSFVSYCQRDHDGISINPFPILHQLVRGIFLVKNQNWPALVWPAVLQRIMELPRSEINQDFRVRIIYLEQCDIPDDTLASLVRYLIQFEKLKRLILNKMQLGPKTVAALKKLNNSKESQKKTHDQFSMDLRNCTMLGFDKNYPRLEIDEHPMLQLQFTPIRLLSLVNVNLADGHLKLILNVHRQLELLDISFNKFTTDGLITFIEEVNKGADRSMSLRSVVLTGNDLHGAEYESHLVTCLSSFVRKPYLQHLDLSLTQLRTSTARVCLEAMNDSRSLQSLHLSGPKIDKLRAIAATLLGNTLFDEMVGSDVVEELKDSWNGDQYNYVPRLDTDEVIDNVSASFQGVQNKKERAKQLDSNIGYSEQRLVFSRLMGHKKLTNFDSWTRRDAVDTFGNLLDIRKTLPEDLQKEIEVGKRQPNDLCWVMSKECWICENWTYYMPIFSKQDISECSADGSQTLKQLNPAQNKIFEKMISQDMSAYESLKDNVPYVIGNMTRHRFVKLESFQDYMLSIDTEGERVKSKFDGKDDKIFNHYRSEWSKVLKNSSTIHLAQNKRKGQLDSNRVMGRKNQQNKPGPLYPYRPHTDIKHNKVFSAFDILFTTALMVKPGQHSCFLVYKFDKERVLKAHFTTNVPIRTNQIVHHHVLPKLKQKLSAEEMERNQDKNYYFNPFKGYAEKQKLEHVQKALRSDFEHWEVPSLPQLQIVGPQGYRSIIKVMLTHAKALFVCFKRLQSTSEAFPSLTYKAVSDWVGRIEIIDQDYTVAQFLRDYSEIKAAQNPPKKVPSKLKGLSGKIPSLGMRRKTTTLNASFRSSIQKQQANQNDDVSKVPSNNLTRFQFMELLVKIAIGKYSSIDERIEPSACMQKLITLRILKSFKESKAYGNPGQISTWMQDELFTDRDTQKMLFLNQFSLKTLFDKLCSEQEQETDAKADEGKKVKKRRSMKRSVSGGLGMIKEAPELQSPAKIPIRRKTSKLLEDKSQLNSKEQSELEIESPQSRMSMHSNQKMTRSPSMRRSAKFGASPQYKDLAKLSPMMSPGVSPMAVNGQSSRSPAVLASNQFDSFQSAVKGPFRKSSDINDDTVTNFNESKAYSMSGSSQKQTLKGAPSVEFNDTQTSININTSNKDLKLLSGASSFKASNLKKGGSPSKKRNIKIQTQYLPTKKEKQTMINIDKLYETLQLALPSNLKKLSTQEVHKLCFTWALDLQYTNGRSFDAIEEDSKRRKKLGFLELLIYICILGKEINKLQVISGMEQKPIVDIVMQVLSPIMAHYKLTLETVPENDTRGIDVFAQDIRLQGKVQKYDKTEVEKMQQSFHHDMFSDEDEHKEQVVPYGQKQLAKDSWQIWEEMKPAKSPKKKLINPREIQGDLIVEMMRAREARYEAARLAELRANFVPDSDEDSDY